MTDFLAAIPDKWMLLSIVYQHPNGISSFQLANIAIQGEAGTGQVNEVRNRMLEHRNCGRVTEISDGIGDLIYRKTVPPDEQIVFL